MSLIANDPKVVERQRKKRIFASVPNLDDLHDLSDWFNVPILTLERAAFLYGAMNPAHCSLSTGELLNCGYTLYQIEKSQVVMHAMFGDIVLGELSCFQLTLKREKWTSQYDREIYDEIISVSDIEAHHIHEINASTTLIKNTVFQQWLKRKNLKTVKQLALEKAQFERDESAHIRRIQENDAFVESLNQVPVEKEVNLLGFSNYKPTPTLELVIDHIDQNLNGATAEYLNDVKAQKEYLTRAGQSRNLGKGEIEAAYIVTRDPESVAKFLKNNPAKAKVNKKTIT